MITGSAEAWVELIAARAAFRGDPERWTARFKPQFQVIDETGDFIVVDKPAPLQVHPARPGGPPTLLDGLHSLLAFEIVNGARLSIINRLDRETSGVVRRFPRRAPRGRCKCQDRDKARSSPRPLR